jgi:membrane protein
MARLREVIPVLRTVGPWTFFKRIIREVIDDDVFSMAASVAYYWLFAIFPLLIFLVSLLPLLPVAMREDVKKQLQAQLTQYVPQASAGVMENVKSVLDTPRAGLMSIGILLTLWAASNGISQTMAALDRCYDIARPRGFFAHRGVSILITIGFVFSIILVLLLIPISGVMLDILTKTIPADRMPGWLQGGARWGIDIARYSVGLTLVMLIISSVYQFGVAVRRRWTLITPGAVVCVAFVVLSGWGFSEYLNRVGQASYTATYGAVGGVVILLLLFYMYACAFLIGAEINSEIDFAMAGVDSTDPEDFDPEKHPLPTHVKPKEQAALERYRVQLIERRRKPPARKRGPAPTSDSPKPAENEKTQS